MSPINKNRAKFGVLSYTDMLEKINCGILDQHDIIYTTDSRECYIVSQNLSPIPIKSKVYCFADVDTAEETLNASTDTYEGQIVSILFNDVYAGYIVNKDKNNKYYVTPLSPDTGQIDYNTLGNRPIVNLIGTLDEPILVESLENGIYAIKGQYKISDQQETIYLSATNNLFMVEKEETVTYIKKITSYEIIDYTITSEGVTNTQLATIEYLNSCGYATTSYVDEKIAALNFITQEEVDTYVEELVLATIDEVLDERIDAKIDEKIQEADGDQITDLFA